MSRFIPPFADVGKGITPSSGAKYFFFESNTSTPKNTYSDEALTTPNTNPVISDSNGLFPNIWFEAGKYKVRLTDKNDVQKHPDADPVESSAQASETVIFIDSVDELRLTEPVVDGQQISLLGHTQAGLGGGVFYYDASDTSTADDDGFTIVTTTSKRWKRQKDNHATPEEFGSLGTGTGDDTDIIEKCIAVGQARINLKHNISSPFLNVESSLTATTTGDAVRGCKYIDGNNVAHNDINHYKSPVGLLKALDRVHFPFALIDSLTSVSNTSSGSDSDGSFFETSDNALDSATNQITINADSDYVVRFQYKGNIQNKFIINFFQSNGTFISNTVVYSGGSGDAAGIDDDSHEVKELYLEFMSPALGEKYNLQMENYAGRSYKIYGVEQDLKAAASRAMLSGVGSDFKGFSAFKINGEFNWAAATLTFEGILQELIWLKDTFKITTLRMWMGLDGGMNKDGTGIYQSFTQNALDNWDRFFIATEMLDISVVPCLLCPIKTDFNDPINMDRRAMTDTAFRDGYGEAVVDFINRYKVMSNIEAWDVINEPYFMLNSDGTSTFTATQITAIIEFLNDKIRTVSTLPRTVSLADGSTSVYGLQTLDLSKIEYLDFHSYGTFLRFLSISSIARISIVMHEIGGSDIGNPSQTLAQVEEIVQEGVGNVGSAWIWESFVRGGTPADYMTVTDTDLQEMYSSL